MHEAKLALGILEKKRKMERSKKEGKKKVGSGSARLSNAFASGFAFSKKNRLKQPGRDRWFEPATPDRETDDLPLYQGGDLREAARKLPQYIYMRESISLGGRHNVI